MIDESKTLYIYGYTSDELKPHSNKPIVVVCEGCGEYRDTLKYAYHELCKSCAMKKRFEDPSERERQSVATKKRYEDPKAREKTSDAGKKHHEDHPDTREKMSIAMKKHHEDDPTIRERMSGENNHNWQGGISFGKYCPKFNNDIRQYIRDKYNNCDYISGIHKDVCNNGRNLDVHHVDYNKEQGCDDHEWRLIPLSRTNHVVTNFNRSFWNLLFTYALQYDETYYETRCIDIWRM